MFDPHYNPTNFLREADLPAVRAEVQAVLQRAQANEPGPRGPLDEGGAWDADEQVTADVEWHTVTLTLTGYLLYYVGAEATRELMSIAHWAVGLAVPLLTGLHVWRGRVWRRLKVAEARANGVVRSALDNQTADGRVASRRTDSAKG